MLVCKEFTFDAAHHLTEYKGKCENIHGHTYKLQVCINEQVKEDGLAFDFVKLKKIVNENVVDILDHSDLNDMFGQPSAENIVIWIWDKLKDLLSLDEIKLWESPGSFVVYRGE